mgnify:CR=1 FL=1
MENYSGHIKAGKIAAKAREWGKSLFREGTKVLDIAEAVENKTRELGAKPGFPCCISVNSIAAHYSPFVNDDLILKKGDLVKFDMGTQINGKVADTACTIEIGTSKYSKLIEASEKALEAAINVVKPGVKIREIGAAIEKTIKGYGFQAITNLNGHGLGDYIVHDDPTIPNYDNGDETVLEEGQAIAIEPFATTGVGKVKDGRGCGIYALINKKPTRLSGARQVIEFIEKEFKTLPFSCRWIKVPGAMFILNQLEKEGIIKQYTQLPEISKGLVSQAEHSLIVGHGVITK